MRDLFYAVTYTRLFVEGGKLMDKKNHQGGKPAPEMNDDNNNNNNHKGKNKDK